MADERDIKVLLESHEGGINSLNKALEDLGLASIKDEEYDEIFLLKYILSSKGDLKVAASNSN